MLKPVAALADPAAPPGPPGLPKPICVVAFARRAPERPLFSWRDRIALERWSGAAARLGITRVRLEVPAPGDLSGVGDFLLIYAGGGEWARWGVGARDDGMVELWAMADGRTLGCFATLAEALDTLVGS